MLKPLTELIAEVSPNIRLVDAKTAHEEIRANNGVLVDVREPPEVEQKPSSATLSVPRGVLEVRLPELVTDPERPIYLHCATGGRARLSAEQLQRIGYRNVSAITCGIDTVCEHFDYA
jgi:rhodanese-related sulfurtransferase